jgi:DNA ligase (NAD+)
MSIIDLASQYYYNGNPILTDEEYDYIEERLGKLTVGCKDGDVKHLSRLYSLEKYYDKSKAPKGDYVETPKLDGSAVALYYINGNFSLALTRGDGFVGRDVTNLMRKFCKPKINISGEIQLVGELVAPKYIENARNYAAGALGLLSEEEFSSRELYFIVYGIKQDNLPINSTYVDDMLLVEQLGFKVITKLNSYKLPELPTDGLVFRLNSNHEFYSLGFTSKYPRGAFALKDVNSVAVEETVLRDVIWQVGGSGKVTPVAIFDEVIIESAKITRATLHNARFIEELNLNIGDTLLVSRAGGIIPKVIGKL